MFGALVTGGGAVGSGALVTGGAVGSGAPVTGGWVGFGTLFTGGRAALFAGGRGAVGRGRAARRPVAAGELALPTCAPGGRRVDSRSGDPSVASEPGSGGGGSAGGAVVCDGGTAVKGTNPVVVVVGTTAPAAEVVARLVPSELANSRSPTINVPNSPPKAPAPKATRLTGGASAQGASSGEFWSNQKRR